LISDPRHASGWISSVRVEEGLDLERVSSFAVAILTLSAKEGKLPRRRLLPLLQLLNLPHVVSRSGATEIDLLLLSFDPMTEGVYSMLACLNLASVELDSCWELQSSDDGDLCGSMMSI
jgi:hypothetical protein